MKIENACKKLFHVSKIRLALSSLKKIKRTNLSKKFQVFNVFFYKIKFLFSFSVDVFFSVIDRPLG